MRIEIGRKHIASGIKNNVQRINNGKDHIHIKIVNITKIALLKFIYTLLLERK